MPDILDKKLKTRRYEIYNCKQVSAVAFVGSEQNQDSQADEEPMKEKSGFWIWAVVLVLAGGALGAYFYLKKDAR